MTEVIWHRTVPPEVQRELKPLIEKYRFMLPRWLNRLTVRYVDDPEDYRYLAFMSCDHEYRQASMKVLPAWKDGDAASMDLTIVHEFTHAPLSVLDAFCQNLIDNVVDETSRAALREEHRKASEAATEDIALAIHGNELARRKRR